MPPTPGRRARRATAELLLAALLAATAGAAAAQDDDPARALEREHAGDAPVPSEAAQREPVAPVVTEEVTYGEAADGTPLRGFLATPAGVSGEPGVIVIHEWWGLNENIRSMTEQLAAQGYRALAVDLYGGRSAETPEQARALVESATADPEAIARNLRQAHDWLAGKDAPRVGAVGWCFGGGRALEAALLIPELDAAVVYYGLVEVDPERLKAMNAPVLGLFGGADESIPLERVRAFEEVAKAQGKDVEVVVYEGAGHAFANPSGTRYRPEAAEDAWRRTLAFLEKELSTR